MKIAVIADIHGNLAGFSAVLEDMKKQKPDQVRCVGDLVGYGPFPNEVIERIRREQIATVQGNYDEGVGNDLMACGCDYKDEKALELGSKSLFWTQDEVTKEHKKYLQSLPEKLSERFDRWKILFVHGSPRANNEYLFEDHEELPAIVKEIGEDILVMGHTHLPYHKRVEGKHVINAGSAGKPKHGTPDVSYILIALDEKSVQAEIRYVDYDAEKTASAIELSGLPVEFADMVRTGRG